jgi:hypothetical protein
MPNQVLYGFTNLQDRFARRVREVGVQVVSTAIQQSVTEHNRQLATLLALFARRTTDFKLRYKTPTAARLQPMDELGRARPIRPAGHYDVAWPIQKAGAALGATYEEMIKMTVEEANEKTVALVSADMRWMRDHVLGGLYYNAAGWTYTDEAHGDLTILGLANGDTTRYLVQNGADQGTTDTHYLAQAASIGDAANPFPIIYAELKEHPENSGDVIAFIPSNLKDAVEGLASFRPVRDANVQEGANTAVLVGNLNAAVPGELIGYVDKVWIVEWKSLPDNYIISLCTEGPRPLAMREHMEAELQGFNQEATRDDHPYFERQWARRAGFGAWNRVGAVVYRIGNASYAIPSGFDSPMP